MNSVPITTIKIREFVPVVKGALRGFVTAELPSGLVLHEIPVLESNGKHWAATPGKPRIGADGTLMRDAAGKTLYSPVVTFNSRERRYAFSDAVIAALRAQRPEVLR